MKKIVALVLFVGLLAFVALGTQHATAAPAATCSAFGRGGISDLSSLVIPFECDTVQTVYFGVCDSGSVINDDWFNIVFNGAVVSSNSYQNGIETVTIGNGQASVGSNTATLNSLSIGVGEATYSYAISPDQNAVARNLALYCGVDYAGTSSLGACSRAVPLFTTDTAPSNGKLVMNVQFGEFSRQEGITVRTWSVSKGERINNQTGIVTAPQYVRVWWQAEGSTEWYLLTSQYWQGDGTVKSEYGVDCNSSGVPSYHTSFESAIAESSVPRLKQ